MLLRLTRALITACRIRVWVFYVLGCRFGTGCVITQGAVWRRGGAVVITRSRPTRCGVVGPRSICAIYIGVGVCSSGVIYTPTYVSRGTFAWIRLLPNSVIKFSYARPHVVPFLYEYGESFINPSTTADSSAFICCTVLFLSTLLAQLIIA